MRTYKFLKSESVTCEAVAKQLAGTASVELLRAVHNPDHSQAGIEIVKALLVDRGITPEQIEAFRWSSEDLAVPRFGIKPTVAKALRRPRRWRLAYRVIQVSALTLFVMFGVLRDPDESLQVEERQADVYELLGPTTADRKRLSLHVYLSVAVEELEKELGLRPRDTSDSIRANAEDPPSPEENPTSTALYQRACSLARRIGDVDELNVEILKFMRPGTSASYAPPMEAAIAVVIVVLLWARILAWRSPARILLLRPFGTKDVSRSLKRFARRNLTFSGHVFTLSDRYLKESLLLHVAHFVPLTPNGIIALLFYPWTRRRRPRTHIKHAKDFVALKKRLKSRFLLNSFWGLSLFDKIRKIRTSDQWWQRCIDLLAVNCEVILVDLTLVKEGTRWELIKIRDQGLEVKSIFIVQKTQIEQGRAVLAEYWPADCLPEVFGFDAKGRLDDPSGFANHFAHALAGEKQVITARNAAAGVAPVSPMPGGLDAPSPLTLGEDFDRQQSNPRHAAPVLVSMVDSSQS